MTNLEPLVVHDRRCERHNTAAHRLTCRCRDRAEARAVCQESGNASFISAESLARGNVAEQLTAQLERATIGLMRAISDAGRVPVPSTLHLVSDTDVSLDATSMRLVVLTVPDGTPLTESLAEVAEDWMRSRRLR